MEYLYFFLFESILILFLPFEHHYSLINLFVSLIYIEKPFFILLSLELILTVVKTFTWVCKTVRIGEWSHIRIHRVSRVDLPSFKFFVLLIKLWKEFLTLCWYFIRLSLDNRFLFDRFCRLDDNLRFHINLGVIVFHDNNPWLYLGFGYFDILQSRLVKLFLDAIIIRISPSGHTRLGTCMQSANKVIHRAR